MGCSKCFSPTLSRLKPVSIPLWVLCEELGARVGHQSGLQHAVWDDAIDFVVGSDFIRASLILSIACYKVLSEGVFGAASLWLSNAWELGRHVSSSSCHADDGCEYHSGDLENAAWMWLWCRVMAPSTLVPVCNPTLVCDLDCLTSTCLSLLLQKNA